MGAGLSQEADTQQSDTKTSQAHENHHNTKTAIFTTNNLPYEFETILKDADTVIDRTSIDKLYAGVFLNNKTKKYWVDKVTNGNCFMVFARDLSVTHGPDSQYWKWPNINKETSEVVLDVAELLLVCWLEIIGKFEFSKLTPGIKYEVVFVVMLRKSAYGWQVPVNILLVLPDQTTQGHKENMNKKPRSKWFEIPVGEFMVEAKKEGFVQFHLYEYDTGIRRGGLVVKGAAIRPKN